MKQEFIPYAESLQLKELGFDEECIGAYFHNQIVNIKYPSTWLRNSTLKMGNECCTGPLYQQVFKWFHKTHKLLGDVFPLQVGVSESEGFRYAWVIHALYNLDESVSDNTPLGFLTPEEAELVCIRKMIEIVKSKQNG